MTGPRHAFVCGLHRSGTSLITRSLARHQDISGFANTGAIEDEGQFLQSVMPLEKEYGGVGRFGFDPRAHLTETSPLNTPGNGKKLLAEWSRHWDMSKPVLIEKTPSNLLRMRLLAALLPSSSFIIVTRHPVASALATVKWTEGNIFSLLCHWAHCYRIARADAALLPRVLWTSYEAFVADPRTELDRMLDFLGLARDAQALSLNNENGKYFSIWKERYYGDGDRAIAQEPPEHYRSLITRARERLVRDAREKSLPAFRRRGNLRNFHDALDAAALLESAIAEFGYSFFDFSKTPRS
ncbi:MAG TPA: sulfotransferase [Rhizomicrobium sp.]|nr:sulfotransferase [Rhizomicrobium sp.]